MTNRLLKKAMSNISLGNRLVSLVTSSTLSDLVSREEVLQDMLAMEQQSVDCLS